MTKWGTWTSVRFNACRCESTLTLQETEVRQLKAAWRAELNRIFFKTELQTSPETEKQLKTEKISLHSSTFKNKWMKTKTVLSRSFTLYLVKGQICRQASPEPESSSSKPCVLDESRKCSVFLKRWQRCLSGCTSLHESCGHRRF